MSMSFQKQSNHPRSPCFLSVKNGEGSVVFLEMSWGHITFFLLHSSRSPSTDHMDVPLIIRDIWIDKMIQLYEVDDLLEARP